jgi:hypothetical protein
MNITAPRDSGFLDRIGVWWVVVIVYVMVFAILLDVVIAATALIFFVGALAILLNALIGRGITS